MSWEEIDVLNDNAFLSYQKKYGIASDYQNDQKLIYNHPEIKSSLDTTLSSLEIESDQLVLDVGINNGYELNLIADQKPKILQTKIIGIDFAEDVLIRAQTMDKFKNLTLLKGDIRDFKGKNILTGDEESIKENSINVLISLLSLQSTSLQSNFRQFLEKLESKLSEKSEIFIGIPNFHITDKKEIVQGLFDAKNKTVDKTRASLISKEIQNFFKARGFIAETAGELVIFQHLARK